MIDADASALSQELRVPRRGEPEKNAFYCCKAALCNYLSGFFGWTQGQVLAFGIVFETGIPLRRALTARLFTGAYHGAIDDIDVPQVLFAVGKRLLR